MTHQDDSARPAALHVQLRDLVTAVARWRPDAPALTAGGRTVTYAQLAAEVAAFGAALHALGCRRSDRVAVYLEKRVEAVVAMFGASAADAIFVPVNPVLRARQVGHVLGDSGARVLVTTAPRLELLRRAEALAQVEHVVLVGDDPAPGAAAPRPHRWDELVVEPGSAPDPVGIDVDVAAILYTSGSTGRPKGVVLSHRNLLAGAASVNAYLRNGPDDRILGVLPLSFDAGFSQLTTGFHVGAHVVLIDYLLPRDVVRACAAHRITAMTGVPPLLNQLADQPWPPEAAAHLRYFANTGGRLPSVTLRKLRAHFPSARPYLMYGLTEAFRSTYLDPAEVDRRPGSIGKAIPNAEILVVREDGTLCGPGEEGELVHRGALVAQGYWNDPERTAERFRPPPAAVGRPDELAVWSGDIVVRDEDGFLYFVGRRDEMIKTSGYRVSPSEIEEVAHATGLVADAAAFGVPDERIGQRVVLVVSGGPAFDVAELQAQLRRELPAYMVPSEVIVRPALPRSPNGKIDRALLRRELTVG